MNIIRLCVTLVFGSNTRKRFNVKVDENIFIGVISSFIYFLWLMQANLHLKWQVRLPMNLLNSLIFVGSIALWTAETEDKIPEIMA
jgi:hypothetical protein